VNPRARALYERALGILRDEIERFHTANYVERVDGLSELGQGSIDYGDTPAYPGVYDASAAVVPVPSLNEYAATSPLFCGATPTPKAIT